MSDAAPSAAPAPSSSSHVVQEKGASSWTRSDEKGRCVVYVSMTIQSVFGMDKVSQTCMMFVELDFKYDVATYIDVFGIDLGSPGAPIRAEDLKIPWLIPNAFSLNEFRSNHFFRVKASPDAPGAEEMSMYGSPENVRHGVELDQIKRGLVVKHEKHSMTAQLRYVTRAELDPFDEIYAFIKVATDGRPGTEQTKFVFATHDNSFGGFEASVGDYEPAGKPEHLEMAFSQTYAGAYPRLYIFQRYKQSWIEAFIEFYLTAYLFNLLMCLVYPGYEDDVQAGALVDESGDHLTAWWTPTLASVDTNDGVAVSATFILADVALLFVAGANSRGFTLSEKVIVYNLALALIFSVWISKGYMLGIPVGFTTRATIVISTAMNLAVWVWQYLHAKRTNERVGTAIREFDFKALDGL